MSSWPHAALQQSSCPLGSTISSDLTCVHIHVYFVSFESSNPGIMWARVTWSTEWLVYLKILDLERPRSHVTSTISLRFQINQQWQRQDFLPFVLTGPCFPHGCNGRGLYDLWGGRCLYMLSTQTGLEPYFVRVLGNNLPRSSPALRWNETIL